MDPRLRNPAVASAVEQDRYSIIGEPLYREQGCTNRLVNYFINIGEHLYCIDIKVNTLVNTKYIYKGIHNNNNNNINPVSISCIISVCYITVV